jgi:hypothetical protein
MVNQLARQSSEQQQSQLAQLQAEKREALASLLAERQRVKELDTPYQQLHQRMQPYATETTRQVKEVEQRAEERLLALQQTHAAELATVRGQVRQLEQQLTQFHATRSELLAQLHSKLQSGGPAAASTSNSAPVKAAAPLAPAPAPAGISATTTAASAAPSTPSSRPTTAHSAPLTASAVVPPPSAYAALATAPLASVARTAARPTGAATSAHYTSSTHSTPSYFRPESEPRNSSGPVNNMHLDDSVANFRKRLNDLTQQMDDLAKQM